MGTSKPILLALGAAAAIGGTAYWLNARNDKAPAPHRAQAPADTGPQATPVFWSGKVSLLAGKDGQFADPYGVATDAKGNVYVADGGDGNRILRITPDGMVTVVAGGVEGFADGAGTQARFNTPSGLAIDQQGNLYVADTGNHAIRKITPDGAVTTLAGSGVAGTADGIGKAAQFNGPVGLAVDGDGAVYVADTYNDMIRKIAPDGSVTTLAGSGTPGDADGPALQAAFDTPCALVIDTDGALLVADTRNDAIRRIGKDGAVSTVARPPDDERRPLLRRPLALARTHDGHVYIAVHGGRILQLTPSNGIEALGDVDQVVQPGYGSDGKVQLYQPRGLALAANGNIIVADAATQRVHRISRVDGAQPSSAPGTPRPVNAALMAAVPLPGANAAPASRARSGTHAVTGGPNPAAADGAQAAPQKAMPWPLSPQTSPHEVVGLMGEVRGNFEGDPRDHFHSGLDIRADVGQPVLAIAPVKVSDPLPNWGYGTLSEGISLGNISYIHMRVGRNAKNTPLDERFQLLRNSRGKPERIRVRRGARFETGDTLGIVNGMAHVHLDYFRQGGVLNPLNLPFPGLRDTIAPRIAGITLFDMEGNPLGAPRERARGKGKKPSGSSETAKPLVVRRDLGELAIVADAWDQMNGNDVRRRLGVYRIGYQLLTADGTPVQGYEQPFMTQRYDQLPRNRDAVKYIYAPNSGITVYGSKATRFAYTVTNRLEAGQVTPGAWRIASLPPGHYILRVHAYDYAGNAAIEGRDLALQIE
ncbi:gluconolaconase [Pseudoduganella ginsengisoli]|uniref:gluconolaconase n=1 Tax=Pseudoduganella ginsengisoli TaxID=1462440 RepID=UPI003530B0CE